MHICACNAMLVHIFHSLAGWLPLNKHFCKQEHKNHVMCAVMRTTYSKQFGLTNSFFFLQFSATVIKEKLQEYILPHRPHGPNGVRSFHSVFESKETWRRRTDVMVDDDDDNPPMLQNRPDKNNNLTTILLSVYLFIYHAKTHFIAYG